MTGVVVVVVVVTLCIAAVIAPRQRPQASTATGLVGELPEVVDLFLVAVRAGLTVPLAVAAVARRADGMLAPALGVVVDAAASGQRWSEALEGLTAKVGPGVRPLVVALTASDRYGVPLGERLERLADDLRGARMRAAEVAARRLPVLLLFPLVFCILPAFALLTVAPLLAGALRALRL